MGPLSQEADTSIVFQAFQHLLRDIASYIKIMEKANESTFGLVGNERNFAPVDFFIPSNYQDNKGEDRPCYLITKKGCDMIANKLTGEKGGAVHRRLCLRL